MRKAAEGVTGDSASRPACCRWRQSWTENSGQSLLELELYKASRAMYRSCTTNIRSGDRPSGRANLVRSGGGKSLYVFFSEKSTVDPSAHVYFIGWSLSVRFRYRCRFVNSIPSCIDPPFGHICRHIGLHIGPGGPCWFVSSSFGHLAHVPCYR